LTVFLLAIQGSLFSPQSAFTGGGPQPFKRQFFPPFLSRTFSSWKPVPFLFYPLLIHCSLADPGADNLFLVPLPLFGPNKKCCSFTIPLFSFFLPVCIPVFHRQVKFPPLPPGQYFAGKDHVRKEVVLLPSPFPLSCPHNNHPIRCPRMVLLVSFRLVFFSRLPFFQPPPSRFF